MRAAAGSALGPGAQPPGRARRRPAANALAGTQVTVQGMETEKEAGKVMAFTADAD